MLVLLLSTVVAGSVGCRSKVDRSKVYVVKANTYEIEFDGFLRKSTIGGDQFVLVRDPEDIRVAAGVLIVGKREYGAVRPTDKISVIGGKVAVNGQERSSSRP